MCIQEDINDKIIWNNINQLHDAVSNFSKQSFDIKKLWITVEVSAVTLMLSMKVYNLDIILLIVSAILLFFYFLDSMTYYYQDKLRESMHNERNAIRKKHGIDSVDYERKGVRFTNSKL